jgi:hypothetical protein
MRRHPRSPGVDIPLWLPKLFRTRGRRLIGFDEPPDHSPINLDLLDEAIEQLYGGRCQDRPPSASIKSRRRGIDDRWP